MDSFLWDFIQTRLTTRTLHRYIHAYNTSWQDDGWDDPRTLWDFNLTLFPRGFTEVAKAAKEGI